MNAWEDNDEVITTFGSIQKMKREAYQAGKAVSANKIRGLEEQLRASEATIARLYRERKVDEQRCNKVRYDLNVWDEGAHNDEDSRWKISVHYLDDNGDGTFSTGDWIEDVEFYLTPAEAKQLTLGVSEEDGGLYSCDSDFFIDPDGFLDVYGTAVPDRVRGFVSKYI
jgi:hypothetical protein